MTERQRVTLELDDETMRCLAVLGEPIAVLAHLAHAAAAGVRHPGHERRDKTNASLQHERDLTDAAVVDQRVAVNETADEVVRLARRRADLVVETARDDADHEHPRSSATGASSERERTRADGVLQSERSAADAALEHERGVALGRRSSDFLTVERNATDEHLTGERAIADTLYIDQREANEQMVRATILAQELADAADAAKQRAEESERELLVVAEFRELFIGILGHDLRNPLSAIILCAARLLQRGCLDEQDQRTVGRVVASSQRMTKMITQLLDLTRARLGGGMPIDAKAADLREVCQQVVEELDAVIELEVEGDLTGTWDHDRLEEALSNIAGNAVEYAAPGTAVIVKAHADGAEVVVEIRNQGPPIPADVLPYIFEPFRRGRPREPSAAGNLGLGLYIASQIVRSHGGQLDAQSSDGTTSFVMRLPRHPPLPLAPSIVASNPAITLR